jgi:hypothetical protein
VAVGVFGLGVAAVALSVAVVVVVVVVVLVVGGLRPGARFVSASPGLEGVLPLAVDAVEQELGDGLSRNEGVVVGHLSKKFPGLEHLFI